MEVRTCNGSQYQDQGRRAAIQGWHRGPASFSSARIAARRSANLKGKAEGGVDEGRGAAKSARLQAARRGLRISITTDTFKAANPSSFDAINHAFLSTREIVGLEKQIQLLKPPINQTTTVKATNPPTHSQIPHSTTPLQSSPWGKQCRLLPFPCQSVSVAPLFCRFVSCVGAARSSEGQAAECATRAES